MLVLKNISKFSVVVHSADGDAIIIPPKAAVATDDKFLWQLDDTQVRIVKRTDDGTHHRVAVPNPVSIPLPTPAPVLDKLKNSHASHTANSEFNSANPKGVQ